MTSIFKHLSIRKSSRKAKVEEHFDVVIIGGGNAAGYVCKTFADMEYAGKVAIISNEPVAPYERPALTKAFLHHPDAKARARLPGFHTSVGGGGERQNPEWYPKHNMSLFLSCQATKLDNKKNHISYQAIGQAKQHKLSYDNLILATGAGALSPVDIKLPGGDLGNVFTIRQEQEAMKLVNAMEDGENKKITIIGGGFIGLECAAALSGWKGAQVTMVYPDEVPLARFCPPEIGSIFAKHFEERGIKIISGARAVGMNPNSSNSKIVGFVSLGKDTTIESDIVIFGIGARLNLGLTKDLPFELQAGGLKVNNSMETSIENIYAIGDIAAFEGSRHEHVDFARKSAHRAASVIADKKTQSQETFSYLPYFYSRLFEYTENPLIFQLYGEPEGKVEVFGNIEQAVKDPSSISEIGAIWCDDNDVVIGAMLVNSTPEKYAQANTMVAEKVSQKVFRTTFC